MKTSALIAMVLTAGFVWGGFALLFGYALRKERGKGLQQEPGSSPREGAGDPDA